MCSQVKIQISAEDDALLNSYFGAEIAKSIVNLYRKIVSNPNAKLKTSEAITTQSITDRQLRTSIHQAIRRIFSSRLESSTNAGGALVILAMPKGSKRGGTGASNNGNVRETDHL